MISIRKSVVACAGAIESMMMFVFEGVVSMRETMLMISSSSGKSEAAKCFYLVNWIMKGNTDAHFCIPYLLFIYRYPLPERSEALARQKYLR